MDKVKKSGAFQNKQRKETEDEDQKQKCNETSSSGVLKKLGNTSLSCPNISADGVLNKVATAALVRKTGRPGDPTTIAVRGANCDGDVCKAPVPKGSLAVEQPSTSISKITNNKFGVNFKAAVKSDSNARQNLVMSKQLVPSLGNPEVSTPEEKVNLCARCCIIIIVVPLIILIYVAFRVGLNFLIKKFIVFLLAPFRR